ncbi:MAG: S1C family serine protease [Candidatus Eiseniibacteriota bacterium]
MKLAMTRIRRPRARLRPALLVGVPILIPAAILMFDALADASGAAPGDLGAVLAEVTFEIAERHGFDRPGGAYVVEVVDGGPADLKGLVEGDIITEFENQPVLSAAELNGWIRREGAGSNVSVDIWRDGRETWLGIVTLAARPNPLAAEDAVHDLRQALDDLRALAEDHERSLAVLRVQVRDLRDEVRRLRGMPPRVGTTRVTPDSSATPFAPPPPSQPSPDPPPSPTEP